MKFFTNKSIWTKIIIVLIFILVFEFVVSKPSLGMDMIEFGGKLVSPVVSLVIALGDGIIEIVHSSIMGTSEALLKADTGSDWWEIFSTIVGAIVAAAAAIAILVTGVGGLFLATAVAAVSGLYTKSLLSDAFVTRGDQPVGATMSFAKDNLNETMYLPAYSISPEEIFQGKIMLFNVDFFGEGKEIKEEEDGGQIKYYYYEDDDGKKVITSPQDLGQELSATISKWYVSLRNIGLVMMMIVLLYIGIRILLSTIASDKAKYKEMLKDWAIGMFLLFSVHYIMIFSNAIVNNITKVISSSIDTTNYYIQMEDTDKDGDGKLAEFAKKAGREEVISEDAKGPNGNPVIVWPTNLMGSLRLKAQLTNWGTEFIGYGICFVIMVFFTLFFIFTYMKRVLYMAFLTLIAPVVAVTYPIDKISDGKAQGFDKWFKEYIFNLLLQPMHLLLYYVLITSAIELSSTNVLYSLIAMGFMIPAEKILRSFFGFEKSKTAGSMTTGAALTMAMGGLLKPKPPKLKGDGSGGKAGELPSADNKKPRFKNDVSVEDAFAGSKDKKEEQNNTLEEKNGEQSQLKENADMPSVSDQQEEKIDMPKQDLSEIKENDNESSDYQNNSLDSQDKQQEEIIAQEKIPSSNLSKPTMRKKIKGTIKNTWGKTKRFSGATLSGLGQSAKSAAVKAPGTLIRGTGKMIGAAAGATIGLAAGAAQGDFGNAMKLAAGGGTLGGTIGGSMTKGISNKVDSSMTQRFNPQTFGQGFSKEYNDNRKYEEQLKAKELKNAKKESKESLRANFNKDEVDEILEKDGHFDNLYSNGVTDKKDMQAVIKMMQSDNSKVDNYTKGAAVVKAANEMGSEYKGLKSKDWENEWTRRFQDKQKMSEKDARVAAKEVMGLAKDFNKMKKDLN